MGFEPATLRTQGFELTAESPCLASWSLQRALLNMINSCLNVCHVSYPYGLNDVDSVSARVQKWGIYLQTDIEFGHGSFLTPIAKEILTF